MNKSFNKLSLLGAALLVTSSAFATEWRTQWISNMGPIRYSFDRLHEDTWNANVWSSAHMKTADSAFMHHGIDKKPLTALFFNKANFQLNEIFPNGQVPFNAQEYSPYLKLMRIAPRANYTETGVNVGGRVDYPVFGGKAFVGLRANVPFRRIEIEREDITDPNADLTNDFVASKVVLVNRNTPTAGVGRSSVIAARGVGVNVFDGSPNAINGVIEAVNNVSPEGTGNPPAPLVTGFQEATDPAAQDASVGSNAEFVNFVNDAVTNVSGGGRVAAVGPISPDLVNAGDFTASQVVASALLDPLGAATMADAISNASDAINAAGDRGDRAARGQQVAVVARAYRLDFVQSLQDVAYESIVTPGEDTFEIFGNDITVGPDRENRATVGLTQAADAQALEASGFVAWMPANATDAGASAVAVGDIQRVNQNLGDAANIGVFDYDTDYSGLIDPNGSGNFTTAAAGTAETLWLTFRRDARSADDERFAREPNGAQGKGAIIARSIERLLQNYQEHPLNFMLRNDFTFATDTVDGLGDIDIDLFYEHQVNDCLIGGASFGIRAPSGQRHKAFNRAENPGKPLWNPYTPVLGNDGHVEIKLAGLLDWDACSWLNIKFDASYSFVLKAKEQRVAAFKGMTVKNIGPVTDAEVHWGYFIGHVDFNFAHPKDDNLRSMVGYEFYYKTRDSVHFKDKQLQSWLGGQYINNVLQPNLIDLDGHVAAEHTESIAHRARAETHYRLSQYVDFYAGGAITFAGQNIMADSDAHCGLDVRF